MLTFCCTRCNHSHTAEPEALRDYVCHCTGHEILPKPFATCAGLLLKHRGGLIYVAMGASPVWTKAKGWTVLVRGTYATQSGAIPKGPLRRMAMNSVKPIILV